MFKKAVILLSLALLSTGLYFYFYENKALRVSGVDVGLANSAIASDTYYLKLKEALEQEFKGYVGVPLWEISLSEMAQALKQISWIKNFNVSRTLLGHVRVELEPEEIGLLWAKPDGTVLPLSVTGKVLEPIDLVTAPDLPILRSKDFNGSVQQTTMAIELMDAVKESPSLAPANLKEIFYSDTRGFSLELFEPDVVVEMGVPPYSTKVQRVEKVIQYLHRKGLKSRVIDATFSKKVLVRARKGPYAD
jgi:cell division septal protein FtsQ